MSYENRYYILRYLLSFSFDVWKDKIIQSQKQDAWKRTEAYAQKWLQHVLENYLEKSVKNARDMYFECNMYFFYSVCTKKKRKGFWRSCLNNEVFQVIKCSKEKPKNCQNCWYFLIILASCNDKNVGGGTLTSPSMHSIPQKIIKRQTIVFNY